MKVGIERVLRETAGNIAPGVPRALKATAALLAGEPDLGVPSALPGILGLRAGGGLFEDCPDLDIGYIREPDRIRSRSVRVLDPEPAAEDGAVTGADGGKLAAAGTGADRTAPRRRLGRVTGRPPGRASDSCAALRPGAGPGALTPWKRTSAGRSPSGAGVSPPASSGRRRPGRSRPARAGARCTSEASASEVSHGKRTGAR